MRTGKPSKAGSTAAKAGPGRTLRIIGGTWRGRKFQFPPVEAIRPTPDRVRETVFNWLQQDIAGARCLDLYAGSGALGLEALSRGAAQVVLVEVDQAVCWHLSQTLAQLGCDRGQVVCSDAARYLEGVPQSFDIAFLDPPFAGRALAEACRRIDERGWLRMGGLAYLEDAATTGAPVLPAGWTLLRSKRAGEVGYHLARRDSSAGE